MEVRGVAPGRVVIGFAVLACGPGLFRLLSRQIVVTESSYLVFLMFVAAAVCVHAVISPFLNKASPSQTAFARQLP